MEVKTFIDESGIFSKIDDMKNRYFVIALLHVVDYHQLYQRFNLVRHKILTPALLKTLKDQKEIKATQIKERDKKVVYETLMLCEDVELGFIVIDTTKLTKRQRENKTRYFNYVICQYFSTYKIASKHEVKSVTLIIDHQNVARRNILTLQEYLNIELYMTMQYDEPFQVTYRDSKKDNLVQLVDYLSNTAYRHLNDSPNATKNMALLSSKFIHGDCMYFPGDW